MESSISADQRAVGGAAAYLNFEKEEQAGKGFRGEYSLHGSSEISAVRGFDRNSLSKLETAIDVQWQGEHWALGINPAYAFESDDDQELRLDGSYLAATAGNWVFGAGALNRWWGPGWQSSLILSNNARPVPSLWLNRKNPLAPESDWLSWVGPWQLTLLAGQLESERQVPNSKMLGMRLTLRPLEGLDIGISRILFFGGEDRPESASALWDALIGRDNSQDGGENDPGNQLGSLDVRYGFAVLDQSAGIYAQMMGEDEAGAFPARKSWLFGVDWTSGLFNSQQQWFFEYTNTLADDFLGEPMPNITYEHFNYNSGYRYLGRNIASSLEGDAEAFTLGTYNFFDDGSNLGLSLSHASLNKDGASRVVVTDNDIFYNVPDGSQELVIANASYGTRAFDGWLDINAQISDKKPTFVSGDKDRWAVSATWRYRF
jgi:hypothetical protein